GVGAGGAADGDGGGDLRDGADGSSGLEDGSGSIYNGGAGSSSGTRRGRKNLLAEFDTIFAGTPSVADLIADSLDGDGAITNQFLDSHDYLSPWQPLNGEDVVAKVARTTALEDIPAAYLESKRERQQSDNLLQQGLNYCSSQVLSDSEPDISEQEDEDDLAKIAQKETEMASVNAEMEKILQDMRKFLEEDASSSLLA
ncbi:unnamed protein product, partial [Amoebophrya sp. A25]